MAAPLSLLGPWSTLQTRLGINSDDIIILFVILGARHSGETYIVGVQSHIARALQQMY